MANKEEVEIIKAKNNECMEDDFKAGSREIRPKMTRVAKKNLS